ncbi:MAG: type II toxin-antitoxin system prevent-host-death family antitoxin [Deltaproteobacteria bacterium]|nr:type II toxin-antitoxin system prevent-host-death family antitoxin [Deltaproteobacteria bacterium]
METIGAYEAKTHLAQLLRRVSKGEKITITKHGVPIATLQASEVSRRCPAKEVIKQMRQFRRNNLRDDLSIREMIEEGRR